MAMAHAMALISTILNAALATGGCGRLTKHAKKSAKSEVTTATPAVTPTESAASLPTTPVAAVITPVPATDLRAVATLAASWEARTLTGTDDDPVAPGCVGAAADAFLLWRPDLRGSTGVVYDWTAQSVQALGRFGSPEDRLRPTCAVAAGRLLVWAGHSAVGLLGGGDVYDPATDDWQAAATLTAPVARDGAVAATAGNQILIYGGLDRSEGVATATGALYDTVGDRWTAVATAAAPLVGSAGFAAWSGASFLVWDTGRGGGGLYDPAVKLWHAVSAPGGPTGAGFHAVWIGDRFFVVGSEQGGQAGLYAYAYDPKADSWTVVARFGASESRTDASLLWTGKKIVVWGGRHADATAFGDGLVYDPAVNSWARLPGQGVPRQTWAAYVDGKLLVIGGKIVLTTTLPH